jgi:hypothetical protein
MTPGDHALEMKIKSIEEEVELKINSPANIAPTALSELESRYETTSLERLKIPMKTPEFKREDTCEFVAEVAAACDSEVTGHGCVRDAACLAT